MLLLLLLVVLVRQWGRRHAVRWEMQWHVLRVPLLRLLLLALHGHVPGSREGKRRRRAPLWRQWVMLSV